MRGFNYQLALIVTSGSCKFCDFKNDNLSDQNLINSDLGYTNFRGANLSNSNLEGANLRGSDLRGANLTNSNFKGAKLNDSDLRNSNLNDANFAYANLSGANLNGVDLTNTNLNGANLINADIRNTFLLGLNPNELMENLEIKIKNQNQNQNNINWYSYIEEQKLNISRYDFNGDKKYIATKEGLLFELNNNKFKAVIDLNLKSKFPFTSQGEGGLIGVASNNKKVYIAYTSRINDGPFSIIVDEYFDNFTNVRNIIKLELSGSSSHFSGSLFFDLNDNLYLSVGDNTSAMSAQNLNSYSGKILKLDISNSKQKPKIIAYGVRNAWGVNVDSKNRMFISQCGGESVESIYMLENWLSESPANLGWPVYEGSAKKITDSTVLKNIIKPIYEYSFRPGCITSSAYLSHLSILVVGDFFGTIHLLKEQENGQWILLQKYKQDKFKIWSFGLDKKSKHILIAPDNVELILTEKNITISTPD